MMHQIADLVDTQIPRQKPVILRFDIHSTSDAVQVPVFSAHSLNYFKLWAVFSQAAESLP